MSSYAAKAPMCDEWTAANAPDKCKDPITYWPDWYGDTPAYAPWAAQIDAKLAEKLEQAQSAPVNVVGVFKGPTTIEYFLVSDEFDKLVGAYLEKGWHLKPYMITKRADMCAFYLNSKEMASMCPALRAVRKPKPFSDK